MDVEKADAPKSTVNDSDPVTEAAAAKMWAVYVAEAAKYDKSLVESWRSDMEGMLIFAGLFSASLTAFLIESYKTLNHDSGNVTVDLLSQISQQLAASANGSTFSIPQPPPFTPSASSLICNALWFISLGLSLSCALIATLIEQWARDFLHKSEIRSAPLIRARIFSFLYYGLKRFNMHTVVEVVPLLLHTSVLLFFAGLVAFLIPVNTTMTVITAIILALVAGIYGVLTFLPLQYLDCPYRTPLSGAFWHLLQNFKILWRRRHFEKSGKPGSTDDETMVEAMTRKAMVPSGQRWARDGRALIWTVRSLSDEEELEPFVEAIPDVLCGRLSGLAQQRNTYLEHFRVLIHNSNVQLYARIQSLLDSCDTGLLSSEARKRRRITCYKAWWAIASIFDFTDAAAFNEISLPWPLLDMSEPDVSHYSLSAHALVRWSNFRAIQSRLADLQQYLTKCKERTDGELEPDLTPVTSYLAGLRLHWNYGRKIINSNPTAKAYLDHPQSISPLLSVPEFSKIIAKIRTIIPHSILFRYLSDAARLDSLPYRWGETVDLIKCPSGRQFSNIQSRLERSLHNVVSIQLDKFNATKLEWIDEIMAQLCHFWRPDDLSVPIPPALIRYLNERHSDRAIDRIVLSIGEHLWLAFPQTLVSHPPISNEHGGTKITADQLISALWHLASCTRYPYTHPAGYQPIIDGLSRIGSVSSLPSVIAMVKNTFLLGLPLYLGDTHLISPFTHPVLPIETAVIFPSHWTVQSAEIEHQEEMLHHRVAEAHIHLLAEFLEFCVSDSLPFKAVETIKKIIITRPPCAPIHETHQTRIARSIQHSFASLSGRDDFATAVINKQIFDLYAGVTFLGIPDPPIPWLENTVAREIIEATFMGYATKSSASADSTPDLARVRAIIDGFDALHPGKFEVADNSTVD